MPDALSDQLTRRLLDVFPDDASCTRMDVEAAGLPRPVAYFLDALFDHRYQTERAHLRRRASGWFDGRARDVRHAQARYLEALASHMRVPPDARRATFRKVAYRVVHHLVRPAPTLADFVFGSDPAPAPPEVVRERMRFFSVYRYFRRAFDAYVTRHDVTRVTPATFTRLAERVDERYAADYGAGEWVDLLDPLFAVARYAQRGTERVDVGLLRVFFEEKKAAAAVRRLDKLSVDALTPAMLHRVLAGERVEPPRLRSRAETMEFTVSSSSASSEPASRPAPDSAPAPSANEPEPTTLWGDTPTPEPQPREPQPREPQAPESEPPEPPEPQPEPRASQAEEDAGEQPLWKRFQRTGRAAPPPAGSAAAEPRTTEPSAADEAASPASGDGEGAAPLWARFQPAQDVHDRLTGASVPEEGAREPVTGTTPSDTPDAGAALARLEAVVFGGIDAAQRAAFIQALFDGSVEAYRRVLERLADADTWGKASKIIARDVFRAYQVNIYSDAAVLFTNSVEAQKR